MKIDVGTVYSSSQSPVAGTPRESSAATFSLRYWQQIEGFGLSHVSKGWFIDFLDGLKSTEAFLERLLEGNPAERRKFHCHPVNWTEAKVRIRRRDLKWLPREILDNEAEFPFFQLSLAKGPMRIAGFWEPDEATFNIVLIDPHHNIAMAEGFEGAQPCTECLGDYHQMLCAVTELADELRSAHACKAAGCQMHERASKLAESYTLKGLVYVTPDTLQQASALVSSGRASNIDEIFVYGILYCQENKSQSPERSASISSSA